MFDRKIKSGYCYKFRALQTLFIISTTIIFSGQSGARSKYSIVKEPKQIKIPNGNAFNTNFSDIMIMEYYASTKS